MSPKELSEETQFSARDYEAIGDRVKHELLEKNYATKLWVITVGISSLVALSGIVLGILNLMFSLYKRGASRIVGGG